MGALKYVLTAIAIALLSHAAALHFAPRLMMREEMKRLSRDDAILNHWIANERVSAQTRAAPRPSPDFATATCVYDLSNGPVEIRTAAWDGYWSLSLYADNSDNFFVLNDRESPRGANILIVRAGKRPPEDVENPVFSPSARGVAMIRRLAPSADAFARAQEAGRDDVCALLGA